MTYLNSVVIATGSTCTLAAPISANALFLTPIILLYQCLWDLLVCWNKREISSSKCGFIYSDCIEAAKKGKPSTDAPVTDLPPPPVPDE